MAHLMSILWRCVYVGVLVGVSMISTIQSLKERMMSLLMSMQRVLVGVNVGGRAQVHDWLGA